MSPCYKKMIFLLSFQMNKCRVSFFSGGDLGSQFYLHLPTSKLKRSFASWHRGCRGCLLWATHTLANFCSTASVNVMISEATCILSLSIPTKRKWCVIPWSQWHADDHTTVSPAPSHAAPRKGAGLPAPGKAGPGTQQCSLAVITAGKRHSSLKRLIRFP